MGTVINLGIDFGSTGLKVAGANAGEPPVMLDQDLDNDRSWFCCEAAANSRLGVSFPSLKSKLGTAAEGSPTPLAVAPGQQITEAFDQVRQAADARLGRRAMRAGIAVPALYSASQRAALRQAALDAGLAEVHLINDSLSAVIAHCARRAEAATFLVYSMGYGGFELGLVRAVRGHYRALGYEGGWSPAGWFFDQVVLEAFLGASAEHDLPLDSARWSAERWLRLRSIAERVKEDLSRHDTVPFPVVIRNPVDSGPGMTVSLTRSTFEAMVEPALQTSLERVDNLLEQADMALSNIDRVLLVGGTTRIPLLADRLAQSLGKPGVVLEPGDLARGAALYAARLAAQEPPGAWEPERGVEAAEADLVPRMHAIVTLAEDLEPGKAQLVLQAARPGHDEPAAEPALAAARQLLEQGQNQRAREVLEQLVRDAQTLQQQIPEEPAPVLSAAESFLAQRALGRARQWLEKGQYEEAVRESHLAWREDRDNPDIFEKMIDIHCQAALARPEPEAYDDAKRWLMCAYNHDESNIRVRQLLAERHFQQAKHLHDHGRRKEALEIVELCLAWDPEHDPARQFHNTLNRR